jgi:hypothetical protein
MADKIDALIVAIQRELKRHNWDYYSSEVEPGGRRVTVPGCSTCRKPCNTTTQFIEHLADDAIPELFSRLQTKKELDDAARRQPED